MHSNYFEKVRKIQKESSERRQENLMQEAKFAKMHSSRSDIIDRIIEKTVGEAGSLSQETTDKEITLEELEANKLHADYSISRSPQVPPFVEMHGGRDNTSPTSSTIPTNNLLPSKLSPRSGPSPPAALIAPSAQINKKAVVNNLNKGILVQEELEITKLVRPSSPEDGFYTHKINGKTVATPAAIEIMRMPLIQRDGSQRKEKGQQHRTVDEEDNATGSGSVGAEVASRVSKVQSKMALINEGKQSPNPENFKPVNLHNVADTMKQSPVSALVLDQSVKDADLSGTHGDSFMNK